MKKRIGQIEEKLSKRVKQVNSLVCVGLDSDIKKLPQQFLNQAKPQFEFNKWIIEQTYQNVCAYKPNFAFYEARGALGWAELALTIEYLKTNYPEIVLIADAKRADIDSTNEGYVTAIFDELGFDAVTLNSYLGQEALQPFLKRSDKACIILCRTSNKGAGELQDLMSEGKPVWQHVAEQVSNNWNLNNNCMLVVGATYPEELARVRKIVGKMTILVPGVGAQGGDFKQVLGAGLNKDKRGLIINSSRGIIFSKNPRKEAKVLKKSINNFINYL